MKNPIAQNMNGQVADAKKMAVGAALLGPAAMPHNTEAAINADIEAAETARQNCEVARGELRGLRGTLETARLTARRLAMFARDVLKPIFGTEYSQAWDVTGLIGSLEIPVGVDDLIVLLNTLGLFFTANPTLEIAVRNITATQMETVGTALSDALEALILKEAEVGQLMTTRDDKFAALIRRMRGVIDECNQVLDPLDPRWKAFGLKMPGAEETPDKVEGLIATLIGPGTAALKWNVPARATYYHVYQRVHGAGTELELIASPDDPDYTLESLPAGSTIDIAIAAVNNGGEGQMSEIVTITTHA